MNEIEEVVSEDLGFRLLSDSDGIALFPEPVDVSLSQPLHLLHVSHAKGLYAASNTKQVGLGHLSTFDKFDTETAAQDFTLVDFPGVSELQFDISGSRLYVLSGGLLYSASVTDLLAAKPSFVKVSEVANISSFQISSNDACLFVSEGQLYVSRENVSNMSKAANSAGINAACWSADGSSIAAVQDSSVVVYSDDSQEKAKYSLGERGRLISIAAFAKNSFYVVGLPEDAEEDEFHTIVDFSSNNLVAQALPLIPGFADVSRAPASYCVNAYDWLEQKSLAFITYAFTTEISAVSSGSAVELVSQLNDTDRAELPMDDSEDTLPVGLALDLSGTQATVTAPCARIEEAKGVLPRLLCLNTSGHLLVWNVFDVSGVLKGTASLERAQKSLPESIEEPHRLTGSAEVQDPKNNGKTEDSLESSGLQKSDSEKSGSDSQGPTSFGSRPAGAFGTSGSGSGSGLAFGATGFGNAAFGQNSFGQNSFGRPATSSSTTRSGFGGSTGFAASASDSPFAKLTQGGGDIFGGGAPKDANEKPNPFGQSSFGSSFNKADNSKSIFGSNSAEKPSPFGSVKSAEKPSPFGSVKSAEKPSPFGSVKSAEKPSPFGSVKSTEKPSPFDPSTKDSYPSSGIFGQKANAPPFGASKNETTETVDKKDTPLFGATQNGVSASLGQNNSTSFGASKKGTDSSIGQPEKPSPFSDMFGKKDGVSALFNKGSESSVKDPSPFAALNPSKSSIGTSNIFKNPEVTKTDENKSESASDEFASESGDEYTEEDSECSEQSVDKLGEHLNATLGEKSMKTAKAEQSSLGQKSKTASLFSPPLSKQIGKENTFESIRTEKKGIFETVETQKKDDFGKVDIPKGVHENNLVEKTEKDNSKEAVLESQTKKSKPYEGQNIADFIQNTQFERFGGFSKDPVLPKDKNKSYATKLILTTDASVSILSENVRKLEEVFEAASSDTNEDMAEGKNVTMHHIPELQKVIFDRQSKATELLHGARRRQDKMQELMDQVSKQEQKREAIEKLLGQLAAYSQALENKTLEKNPLDAGASALRLKLRQKLARAERLQTEASEKLVPLGILANVGDISKFEAIAHEIHYMTRDYERHVEQLRGEIEALALPDLDALTLGPRRSMSTRAVAAERKLLGGTPGVRVVEPELIE